MHHSHVRLNTCLDMALQKVLLQYLELCHGRTQLLAISGRGILSSDDVDGHVARTIFSHPIRYLNRGRLDLKGA